MIQALIGPVTGLLDKFIEDKDQKNKLAHELATMADHAQELCSGQLEINKAEAASTACSSWLVGVRRWVDVRRAHLLPLCFAPLLSLPVLCRCGSARSASV
jgi:hypothetical protein